ncbi:hypothetical protein FRB99_001673 [Tulasnella sp. 403]|nr:hypothetical protein FRB99_001673 [Tulasnella sp. 403]
MSKQVTHEVLSRPAASVRPVPREYTPDQQAMIEALREYAFTLLLPESDPYHPNERRWLEDPGCAARYMRAAKWKLEDGKKRIKGTIEWRRQYKPDLISADEVKIENETGKILLNGFDNEGRPIITMHPGRQNTKTSERQILHLIFCLERAIDYMPPGQDSMVILVDYKSATLRSNPSISTANKVLQILQNHYVERLGRAIVTNLPSLLNFFFKGIQPFLDPVTRDKMRFNPNLPEIIPLDHLDAEFGGNFHYQFDQDSYWEQILAHCGVNPDGSRFTPEWKKRDLGLSTPSILSSSQPDLVSDDGDDDVESSREPSLKFTRADKPLSTPSADEKVPVSHADPAVQVVSS